MLRIFFTILILLHALIHLFGFIKAFEFAKIDQLSQDISKPVGIFWLITAFIFMTTTIAFLLKKDWWWAFAFSAILLSQVLIFFHWHDAKFGSIANVIVLLVSLWSYGTWNFENSLKLELSSFRAKDSGFSQIISKNSISDLPEMLQLWLINSNVIGKEKASNIHLQQVGKMKIKVNGAWMKVNAEQWFTIEKPGFIWNAHVGSDSFIQFSGRDKLIDGKGSMLIKLYSLVPIVNAEGPKIDQGSMLRYLAEIVWFPSAALSKYIVWEEISPTELKATMTYNNLSLDGIFTFSDEGRPLSFRAKRYYGATGSMETWQIDIDQDHFKSFDEIVIPTKASVTWKLKEGDFRWFEVEIKDLEEKG